MLTWWSWKNQRNILTTSKFLYLKLLQSPVKTACMNFLNWKSSHRFTYAMMLKVDRIRNAANAFSLLYHEVFSKRTTFKEDMLSYLGKLPFTFGLPSWNKVFESSLLLVEQILSPIIFSYIVSQKKEKMQLKHSCLTKDSNWTGICTKAKLHRRIQRENFICTFLISERSLDSK